MEILLSLLVLVAGAAAYCRFTVPILHVQREGAEPEVARLADRGWIVNWLVTLAALVAGLVLSNPVPFMLVFLGILTGAWLELVMKHEGAP